MSVLPPPAATLVRVLGATVRLGLAPSTSSSSPALHVLAGSVARCGHRTSAEWQAYAGEEAPAMRLCRRCLAGLPAEVRAKLEPTSAELARVYERQARAKVDELVELLAAIRTEALVDGAAYERTALVEAKLAPHLTTPRPRWNVDVPTRRERDARVGGYLAAEREVTLLDLLNLVDPTAPHVPHQRRWLGLTAPAAGEPVHVPGGTYDPALWMGRKR